MQTLGSALPDLAVHGAIGGASGVPDPTDTRARTHHDEADLSAGASSACHRFHPRRVGGSGGELIPDPADRFGGTDRPPLDTVASSALISRIPYDAAGHA